MPRKAISSLLLAAALASSSVGLAAALPVPDPSCSVCPSCIVMDPSGGIVTTVNVRDMFCIPITGATVVIDFGSSCTFFCPTQKPGVQHVGNTLIATTGVGGNALFPAKGGGCCPGPIRIYADGVQICQINQGMKSPDMLGTGQVGLQSLAAWAAAQVAQNLCGDFNCDGQVNVADLGIWAASGAGGGC